MPSLLPHQIDDLVNLTQKRFIKRGWVDLSLNFQHYEFARRNFKDKKVAERGGHKINWKVQVTNTGTFKHTGLFAKDTTNVKNLTKEAETDWTKQTVNYEYDVDEEIFNSEPEQIVDELKVREHSMYNDFFEGMEISMWTAPSSSSLDPMTPQGIPFWLQKNATEGFNGGDPSGWSAGAGGLLTALYPNWKNWTFTYSAITRDDFIEKVLKAMAYTKFMPPHDYNDLGTGGEPDWTLYGTWFIVSALQKVLEGRNDNLGANVGWAKGKATIQGAPVYRVPALDDSTSDAYDSTDPLYGVNWKTLRYYFRKGRNMLRYPPKPAAHQHTVREVHMDNWGNWRCLSRRRNFVGYKV